MAKKVWLSIAGGVVALAVVVGIFVLIANVLGYRPSSRVDDTDEEDETERSYYRDETDPTTTTSRETQGRDYYENGGYKGMDNYFIIQDLTTEEIIAEYEYYHDLAHTYDIADLKDFDKELKHPAYSQVDASGYGLYMFYDLILPDEKIDHVVNFDVEGTESTGAIEFSMKLRIHDPHRASEIYNAFIDRYSAGAQGSEPYNMMRTFDKGVRITVDDTHDWLVCYKKVKDKSDYYWLIYVSEDY